MGQQASVVVGIPQDLEEKKYTLKNGDKAGEEVTELSFTLYHPLTAVSGSQIIETKSERIMKVVREAADESLELQVVVRPKSIRTDRLDRYGRPDDWVKLVAVGLG